MLQKIYKPYPSMAFGSKFGDHSLFQSAGIRPYVEGLEERASTEFGSKNYFEIACSERATGYGLKELDGAGAKKPFSVQRLQIDAERSH
jgi:hypothetical protein